MLISWSPFWSVFFLWVVHAEGTRGPSAVRDLLHVINDPGVLDFRTGASPDSLLVFDVGYNNGADTKYFLSQGYRVVGVDANPQLIAVGKQEFAQDIKDKKLLLLNYAFALDHRTNASFWIHPTNDVQSSFDRKKCQQYGGDCNAIAVDSILCAGIWGAGTPYILKIDIEEYHYVCLEALLQLPQKYLPKYVTWELHEMQQQKYPIFDIKYMAALNAIGYTHVKQLVQSSSDQSQFVSFDERKHGFTNSTDWVTVSTFLETGVVNPRKTRNAWCDFVMRR